LDGRSTRHFCLDRNDGIFDPLAHFLQALGGGALGGGDNFGDIVYEWTIVTGDEWRLHDTQEHETRIVGFGEVGGVVNHSLAGGGKIDWGKDRFHGWNMP
jgi:hypothetical protein